MSGRPIKRTLRDNRVYPGFPTPFWGLSGFFVGDLIGKALWELVENAQRFPRHGGRVLCVHGAVSFHRARPCATRWLPGRGPCVMSNWTAASSDCSRPANNYVRVNTVDLYTPNARFTTERLGYQVLTLFGKLGYSRITSSTNSKSSALFSQLKSSGHRSRASLSAATLAGSKSSRTSPSFPMIVTGKRSDHRPPLNE